ncbi:MAG: hypothetical protein VX498_12425, partial [Myxococcota bacterium]|nr:hypothetical protein [Myxococcota bacterium]
MRTLSLLNRIRGDFLLASSLVILLITAVSPAQAGGEGILDPVPVVRGIPPAPQAPVVALCPDISERPEVFLARGRGSLAATL